MSQDWSAWQREWQWKYTQWSTFIDLDQVEQPEEVNTLSQRFGNVSMDDYIVISDDEASDEAEPVLTHQEQVFTLGDGSTERPYVIEDESPAWAITLYSAELGVETPMGMFQDDDWQ